MAEPKMKYTYFVTYAFGNGLGNIVFKYDKKVNPKTIETFIKDVTKYLQRKCNYDRVVITDFKLVK